jgi:uncharacterized phage protein (TIGR02218 family)
MSSWVFDALGASAQITSGDGAVIAFTQAGDGVSATVAQTEHASVTFTQAANTVAATVAQNDNVSVSFTQGANTVAATVAQTDNASITFTQAANTVAATGIVFAAVVVAFTQAANAVAATVAQNDNAAVSFTQAANTIAATVQQTEHASIAFTQAAQTVAATATQLDRAVISFTQAADIVSALGVEALPYGSWWDGWFPGGSPAGYSWWGGWFPEGEQITIPPAEPLGIASFVLTLESTAKLSQRWITGISKSYSGRERRSSTTRDPAFSVEGQAKLMGPTTRAVRSRIARFAAAGQPFWIGMPHEEITVRANSTGTVIPVFSTARSDWAVPGCPVFLIHNFYGSVQLTVQSATLTTVTVDQDPGLIGSKGARLMPAIPMLLDPQQAFDRYPKQVPDPVEVWKIKARNVNPGFMRSATWATLELASLGGSMSAGVFRAPLAGEAGNDLQIKFVADAVGVDFAELLSPTLLLYHFIPDVTTVLQMMGRIERMDFVVVFPADPSERSTDTLKLSDEFGPTNLSGGMNAGPVPVGLGASVSTYRDRPLWDKGISVSASVMDSSISMALPQDLGGLPFVVSVTQFADWGRGVAITGEIGTVEHQWFKLFCDTVRGCWKGFYLTTAREDLLPVSSGAGTLTVQSGEDAGDFYAWWPKLRTHLEIIQEDDTVTRVRISGAVDNGDDTLTMTIVDENDDPVTLSGEVIESISWLELVRIEGDGDGAAQIDTNLKGALFQSSFNARVIQDFNVATQTEDFVSDEASIEESEPVEGIEFARANGTFERLTTGTRDATINGETYIASPGARGEIKIIGLGGTGDGADSLEVHVPMSHPIATRWMTGSVPPQRVTVNIWRKQMNTGAEEIIFTGEIQSLAPSGHVGKFTLTTKIGRTMDRTLPRYTVGPNCGNTFGDDNCTVDVEALKISTTVSSFTGRTIKVAAIGGHANNWARGGRVRHVDSKEEMTIFSQTGTTIEMQFPILELGIGSNVEILPGCGKDLPSCASFSNVINFAGQPHIPTKNLFRRTRGQGVIV